MRKAGEPPDDHGDAFNEDLSRILLGEFPLEGAGAGAPSPAADHVRRQAGPLLEELTLIGREMEGATGRPPADVQADGRRIREIAAALVDLLALSRAGRSAA